MPRHQWKPGESGNPNGRPAKEFAKTGLLESIGRISIEVDGEKVTGNRFVAQRVWDLVTTGKTVLLGGKQLEVSGQGWFEVVEWLFKQTEPAVQRIEQTGPEGGPLEFVIDLAEGTGQDNGAASGAVRDLGE